MEHPKDFAKGLSIGIIMDGNGRWAKSREMCIRDRAKAVYVGVGSKARKMKKAYIGIGGTARKVKKMYIGVGGKARLCYSAAVSYTHLDGTFCIL